MSDRDYLDLDDDLPEIDDAAAPSDWDADLLEDFPQDDPAASDPPTPTTDAAGATAPAAATTAPPSGGRRSRPRGLRLHRGTGALVFLLVVLAGLLLGSSLLTATGAAPERLLDFSGFGDPLTVGDFRSHPVNAFWIGSLMVLVAASLAALAVERRLRDLRETVRSQEAVLDAVRRLDPDTPDSWRDEQLQADADLAAVTSGLLGHVNLQQAKLSRYVGLEGELHRLEKAMAEESTVDLQGRWESPAAGSLADQAARLLAARDQATSESQAREATTHEQGPELIAGLQSARQWSGQGLEQMGQQGAVAERMARRLTRLAEQMPQDEDGERRRERLQQAVAAVQKELAALPARAADAPAATGALATLIERASRLAFQIAMEVARLGAKGERLLPLTQDLEELTTELRGVADRGDGAPAGDDPRDRALENIRGRVAELDPEALAGGPGADVMATVAELAPEASRVAQGLAQMSQGLSGHARRLGELVDLAADLTGIDPANAAGTDAGMDVERFDPFASGSEPEDAGLVADPFASSSSGSIFDTAAASSEFAHTVLPGDEDRLLGGDQASDQPAAPAGGPPVLAEPSAPSLLEPVAPEPGALDLGGVDPFAATAEPPAAEPLAAEPPAAEPPLPSPQEKVYDLAEFGAERLPPRQPAELAGVGATAGDAADRIYDLAELGAERIS